MDRFDLVFSRPFNWSVIMRNTAWNSTKMWHSKIIFSLQICKNMHWALHELLVTWLYSHFNNFLSSSIIILFLSLATQVPASLLYHQASLALLSKSPTRSTQKGIPKGSFKVRLFSSNLLAQGRESEGSMAVCIPSNQGNS